MEGNKCNVSKEEKYADIQGTRTGERKLFEFVKQSGETGEIFMKHYESSYEDGVFDQKTKRLMAMVGAIAAGCEGCIIGQAKRAIALGATRQEVIEACKVAASLGGTMAMSKIALVMMLMDEGI